MNKKCKVVVITGPTATGKTALAVDIARKFDGEIISVDSRQVYRGLDLGSGKDLDDYSSGGPAVPYHLIDVVDPMEDYHLMRFCNDAAAAVKNIAGRGKLPVFCGGTALYLNALLRGYSLPGGAPDDQKRKELKEKPIEELRETLRKLSPQRFEELKDKDNPNRIIRAIEMCGEPACQVEPVADMIEPLVIAPFYPRKTVHHRIELRLDQRLDEGMIEEVEQLHANGVSWEKLEFFGLEYRYVALYLQDKLSRADMRDQLLFKIRQFAKRQDIWFRKMEREGLDIYWLDKESQASAAGLIETFLAGQPLPPPAIRIKDIHYGPVTSKADK